MTVEELVPCPTGCAPFRRDQLFCVPAAGGCYTLATVDKHILYIGLSANLRGRMDQHLDTPEKVRRTAQGRAIAFHWVETDILEAVERGWLNSHRVATGVLPILNKMDSPVSS